MGSDKRHEEKKTTDATDQEISALREFLKVIKTLRHPEKGCPWDLKQTQETLRNSILEEAYECVEAINNKDNRHVQEELGDIMLVVFLINYINEQDNQFSISDTIQEITRKLIRRHPHVFKEENNLSPDQVVVQWDRIKEDVEGKRKKDSILDDIKEYLPPLVQSYQIQKKAAKVGFDWKNVLDIFDKLDEEKNELLEAIYSGNRNEIEDEIGDMLFSVVNISRFMKVEPNIALLRTITKFKKRFRHIESELKKQGKETGQCTLEEMDELWNDAKKLT